MAAAVSASAGIVLFRRRPAGVDVLLGHMGGPFWARRDEGAWSIPKGELDVDEEPLTAARREFSEELGSPAPDGPAIDLGEIRQSGGKRVRAWAIEGDLDVTAVVSGTFELEWPPRSGRTAVFPEIDRAAWFELGIARTKVVSAQAELFDRLARLLAHSEE